MVRMDFIALWSVFKTALFVSFVAVLSFATFSSFGQSGYVSWKPDPTSFPLAVDGNVAALQVSSTDFPGVIRAAKNLQTDIQKVTGTLPEWAETIPSGRMVIVVGTIGKNPIIDQLIQSKKLDVSGIKDKWEASVTQVVNNPNPGTKRALVIAGSDKRGTIFAIYELSRQIGVSPWYWWADVPVDQNKTIYVKAGRHVLAEPSVKYRGIFINDEQPALGGWVRENYGGFKHGFYERVFELILRNKGNFLWPAMWGQSFYSDDPLSPQLADEYGIVISTSHHEPMMRAHVEWQRSNGKDWNYATNENNLREFWKEGIKRMGNNESIVTLAMRGDGDMGMSATTNTALLERIVADQRKIVAEVTGKGEKAVPQVWALYKEVQDYYDAGMRVPDDVTLLLCDDNWGNIRKLPKPTDPDRTGGYGIYYHFDYVGGPRNYKWINTNPIARVWEQMNLAYEYEARQIWVVNVGDIKTMEYPISFFLEHAWDPKKWNAGNLDQFARQWAEEQFGAAFAPEIARILTQTDKLNGRRKPELLSPETYSLIHYREAETVVRDFNKLTQDAENIYKQLRPEYRDAFYQLVLFPVKAPANLNELYFTVARNRLYAKQGRASANPLAETAETLYKNDQELTTYYNTTLASGKWNHMMDQTHIGYTYWQQPNNNSMPEVKRISVSAAAEMGVSVEGSENWWPDADDPAVLPAFDNLNNQSHYFEIFNRGAAKFDYTVIPAKPWLRCTLSSGVIEKEVRISITVDWAAVPVGNHQVPITVTGPDNSKIVVNTLLRNFGTTPVQGFLENNGVVSIEASHFTSSSDLPTARWTVVPDLGRTLAGVTIIPPTAPVQAPGSAAPHLDYAVHLLDTGKVNVLVYLSPTLNFHNGEGLRYGISFDNETPKIVNMHDDNSNRTWETWVSNNTALKSSVHSIKTSGPHVLKFWMIDPGVVIQKIVIDRGGLKDSYLGPPESNSSSIKKSSKKK